MKFSAVLSLSAAALASAKSAHNSYPVPHQARSAASAELLAGLPLGMAGAGVTGSQVTEVIIIWANPGAGAPTININQPAGGVAAPPAGVAAPPAPPPSSAPAAGQTHHVTVGGPSGLVFNPDQIKANVGDMVVFTFLSQNHTVTQSTFPKPCDAMAGGMNSGFMANPNNSVTPPPQVAMQVMVSDPLWFYCAQKGHCGKGMTFSINPTAAKTQAMFQSMAIAQKGTGASSPITGGTPAAPPAAPPAASAPAAAAPAAPAAPAAGGAAGGNIQQGTGQINGAGACVCAVTCSAGSFPAVNAQGVGSFGGMAGSLPMNMMEA
ncbi:Cupredoxin [Colletotrichum somersetense]|nr:Cupredoxin [Colletotrichum somersetense]